VQQTVKEKQTFERVVVSREEALAMFEENKFKVEIIRWVQGVGDGVFGGPRGGMSGFGRRRRDGGQADVTCSAQGRRVPPLAWLVVTAQQRHTM
jgi:hypothetical protein